MNTVRLPNPSNPFGSVFSLPPENSSADQTAELQLWPLATRPNRSIVAMLGVLEFLYCVADREAAGLLARREVLQGLQFLGHDRLRRGHHEHALDVPFLVLAGFEVRLLERVRAQVEQQRRAQRHKRFLPDAKPLVLLLEEDHLPLVVAQAREVAVVGPVEELAALVVASGEKITLVVAVEVDLERFSVGVVAVQELRGDVRLAAGGH